MKTKTQQTKMTEAEDHEVAALREAMELKYGEKTAHMVSRIVAEVAVTIALKSRLFDIDAMQLTRCTADTLAGMIAGIDRMDKEKKKN